MIMDSLPHRPLLVSEVSDLSASSERIADTSALTVLEIGGQAEIALSIVMSTYAPAYFGFVFDRKTDAWRTVFTECYETKEEAHDGFKDASDAIIEYWNDHTSMTQSDEMTTPDGVTFDEYTITDIDEDVYTEYFQ